MKSQSYPEKIPAHFAADEKLTSAYRSGWSHGHGIACHVTPKLGDTVRTDSLGKVTVDAENIREVHESLCHESADGSRDFSPFEFLAKEFNDCDEGGVLVTDPDGNYLGVFATEEEAKAKIAEEAEDADDAEGFEMEPVPSAEEMWDAFEEGTADAIAADLATYTPADYGFTDWENTPEGFVDFTLPEYWASYLINGDASGLEDSELAEIQIWEKSQTGLGGCVDCSESEFCRSNDANALAGNCSKFRFPILKA
jgi:hypothetical protein